MKIFKYFPVAVFITALLLISGCSNKTENQFKIEKSKFGKTADGAEIYQYTLSNSNNMTVKIINYGGIVRSILVPDKNGNPLLDVVTCDKLNDF